MAAGGVAAGTFVNSGWGSMTALVTPGNWNRALGNDLLARDAGGSMWSSPGDTTGGFGSPAGIGHGWNGMTYRG